MSNRKEFENWSGGDVVVTEGGRVWIVPCGSRLVLDAETVSIVGASVSGTVGTGSFLVRVPQIGGLDVQDHGAPVDYFFMGLGLALTMMTFAFVLRLVRAIKRPVREIGE